MLGKCSKCPADGWLDQAMKEADLHEPTMWNQWERTEQTLPGKRGKSDRKIIKICKEGTVEDVFMSLEEKLSFFLEHVFVKRQQAKYFEQRVKTLTNKEAVIQVDFAENYACKYQDEIQSAHWSQEQVTIFTVAILDKGCPQQNLL